MYFTVVAVRKKLLAMVLALLVVVGVAVWLVQNQLGVVQARADELATLNGFLEGENHDLQDAKRTLLFNASSLESQNEELLKQLGDLTGQLALERVLNVKIVSLVHDAVWSDYGSFLGRSRARMAFNVTVRNDDVVALGGLELTVRTFSGSREVGWIFHNDVDSLMPGETRIIQGESITPADSMADLSLLATLKSSDVIVDELKVVLNA